VVFSEGDTFDSAIVSGLRVEVAAIFRE